jgi:hypothetical protein
MIDFPPGSRRAAILSQTSMHYLPAHLFSIHLGIGDRTQQMEQSTHAQHRVLLSQMSPVMETIYQAVFMPSATPTNPKPKAAIATEPGGSKPRLAHDQSECLKRNFGKSSGAASDCDRGKEAESNEGDASDPTSIRFKLLSMHCEQVVVGDIVLLQLVRHMRW